MPDTPEILQCKVNQMTMSDVSCWAQGGPSVPRCHFNVLVENIEIQSSAFMTPILFPI